MREGERKEGREEERKKGREGGSNAGRERGVKIDMHLYRLLPFLGAVVF